MSDTTIKDRAAGAIMGAFIGDALALGPHWYYDLDELRRDYGEWITGYTDPKPGRYHAGLKAGQLSQAGIILKLTLRSLVECGRYDEAEPLLLLSHEHDLKLLPQEHPNHIEGMQKLIELYDAWGKPEQADAWRAKLSESSRSVPASQSTDN